MRALRSLFESSAIASEDVSSWTKSPTRDRVRDRADPDPSAQRPREPEDDPAYDHVRRPERERRLVGKALVEDVPGREPEVRLEQGDDAGGEDEEAADEDDEAHPQRPAELCRNVHG